MADFYQKYRSLFEENEGMYKLQMGYDIPKTQMSNQQLSYAPKQQPQNQYSFEHQPQQQKKQTYTPPPIKESPARGLSQNQNRTDDQRIRKQVMHENIFQQPVQQPVSQPTQITQYQQPTYVKPNQQTYNVFQQEKDILDSIVPQRQRQNKQKEPVLEIESNIHRVYMQRMSDLDQIKKRYVDQKQLSQQLDTQNPYKYALQKRVLTQMNPQRKSRLRDLLK